MNPLTAQLLYPYFTEPTFDSNLLKGDFVQSSKEIKEISFLLRLEIGKDPTSDQKY